MHADEFRSWVQFYEEEPFGDVRADLRAGITSAIIARTMGGRKGAKPIDYMPIVAEQRKHDAQAMSTRAKVAAMRQTFVGNLGPMRVRHVRLVKG